MENADYSIILDVTDMSAPVSLNVKQGDAGRSIEVHLSRDGVPLILERGSYAVFAGKKPDEKILWNSCSIRDSTIFYEITKQTTAVVGWVPVQIRLYRPGGKLVSSPDFVLIVDGTVTDDEEVVIVSENEVTALTELVSEAADAIEHALNVEGKSAYQVAQEAGFEGTVEEWLDSLVGPKGGKGDPGPQGQQGPQGDPGKDGGSTTITLKYGVSSTPSMNTITGWQDTIPQMSETYPYLWIEITTETTTATGGSSTIEAGIIGYYSTPDSGGNGAYTLPVANAETLGGVKPVAKTEAMTQPVGVDANGALYTEPESTGDTVEVDTTLTKEGMAADAKAVGDALKEVGQPTDEQIAGAVSDWIEANPDKVTTVQDESITREKIANTLLEELGLEPNHHLTEVQIPVYRTAYNNYYDGKESGTGLSTKPFPVPQYIKVVSKTSASSVSETLRIAGVRFADAEDWETATYKEARNIVGHGGAGREADFLNDPVADDETVVISTNEYGATGKEYIQLRWQNSNWNKYEALFDLYAIYDDVRPKYRIPSENGDGYFVEDLPVKWVYNSFNGRLDTQRLWGVVPYYPDFTYYVRGGAYMTTVQKTLSVHALFDDKIFEGYSVDLTKGPSNGGCRGAFDNFKTTQFDESVSGGADIAYAWAYVKTPTEAELTGPKWLAFEMASLAESASNDLGAEYYEQKIQEINDSGAKHQYISRWEDKDAPRRLLTTMVRKAEGAQDEGSRHAVLMAGAECPLRNARWVLFGDSLTDNYGGHDLTGNYFATKIAREFGLLLDNRAKGGSNIYAGGSGNYTSVSGIVMLDAYLAEIEAGTTEQADYITVAFGTNAFRTDIGTNEDTSETYTASMYGATKYFIEKIREKVPNAVLGFVLSPKQQWPSSADPNGARDIDSARTAIKTVCDEYGVPYIDMSTQSGITVAMLPDGIHIRNDQSQKLYYHAMRRFMMGL